MLISDSYRQLNRDLHSGGSYGLWGSRWVDKVGELIRRYDGKTVLDYGCGQGALARELDFPVAEYDPAISGKDHLPGPADIVVCTDVMEHIEPEHLDEVLEHLRSLSKKCLFAVISTRPAAKILADGRNAHLIIEPSQWWEEKVRLFFNIEEIAFENAELSLVLRPLSKISAFCRLITQTWWKAGRQFRRTP